MGVRAGARAAGRPHRRLDRRAGGGAGEARQHVRARRPRGRAARGLSQAAHVRRGSGRACLSRVRPGGARGRDRLLAGRRRHRAGPFHLLRPALPRAVSHPRRARRARDRRRGGVHAGDHARSLGDALAGAGNREPGLRGRSQPGGRASRRAPLGRTLDDRRPMGAGARAGARRRGLRDRRARPRAPGAGPRAAALARQPSPRGLPLAAGGERMSIRGAPAREARATADKRRVILDAAVRVFARQGFHSCRVSDIADEAGVAYGLVYHYFASKDEVLDTLFLERWNVMLDLIREVDAEPLPLREKLGAIAAFIIDSYRHDPDLMKVIIVEVTRAANSFGQTHLAQIRTAYELIGAIVERAQADGDFKPEIEARFAAMAFYGAIEQLLTGWIFDLRPQGEEEF